jgi:heterodisulfide reductase subunit A
VAYIDESCLYLKEKKCRICEAVCENKAIDFNQVEEKQEINVGAVILSAGLEPFDPKIREEYRYGEYQNVVTSMDFERLLSSTGAY